MRVLVAYRAIPQSPGWSIGESICRALARLGHEPVKYAKWYQRDAWDIGDRPEEVDALIYYECNDADPQYGELAALKCPKIYWEADTAMHEEATRQLLRLMKFDYVAMANRDLYDKYDAIHLPLAVDDEAHYPLGLPRTGAVLVGSPFPPRVEFCRDLGVPLVSSKFREQLVETYNRACVGVNFYPSGGTGLEVCRVYEVPACGAALLTQWTPGIAEMLQPHEVATFTDLHSARDALTAMLAGQWMEIADAGTKAVLERHTYVQRLERLFEYVA